jgi:hypothetical protein
MRISHKYKFVYIAVTKTGSTTVRKMLNPLSDVVSDHSTESPYHHHTHAVDLKKHFKERGWNWDEYFKFSFVRNPWSRLVSLFNYQREYVRGYEKDVESSRYFEGYYKRCKKNTHNRNFEVYVDKIWMGDQFDFLYDENNNQLVDFVGKTENLQEDFNTICDKIGIPRQELPHKNKTKHKHYTEYYDDETRELVAEKYAKDIEYFGYEFGE